MSQFKKNNPGCNCCCDYTLVELSVFGFITLAQWWNSSQIWGVSASAAFFTFEEWWQVHEMPWTVEGFNELYGGSNINGAVGLNDGGYWFGEDGPEECPLGKGHLGATLYPNYSPTNYEDDLGLVSCNIKWNSGYYYLSTTDLAGTTIGKAKVRSAGTVKRIFLTDSLYTTYPVGAGSATLNDFAAVDELPVSLTPVHYDSETGLWMSCESGVPVEYP
jgi:hypothetical protein